METRVFSRSWFSLIISYSILGWTIFSIIGTWFIILKYGILLKGLIAILTTFLFATAIWAIPLTGLIVLSLWLTPEEDTPSSVWFKEMIRKGMRRGIGGETR